MKIKTIENIIAFKFEMRYYPELMTPETVRLLGSTENMITNDKNGENERYLEITEVILWFHCNIIKTDCQQKFKGFVYICSK